MDPERAHHIAFVGIRWAGMTPLLGALLRRFFTRRHTPVQALGRDIPAVFGVAAGFDKNGTCVPGLTMLGFGWVEVGTITALAQPGNERPRLWRVRDKRAIRNRMGFNNDGAAAAAAAPSLLKPIRLRIARLSRTRHSRGRSFPGCARAVIVPTSTQPKPSMVNPGTHVPFLSKPAATPNTAGMSRPSAWTGVWRRVKNRRSRAPSNGVMPAQRIPTNAMWWARSGSIRRKTWLKSSRYTPATYRSGTPSRGRVRANHHSPTTARATGAHTAPRIRLG